MQQNIQQPQPYPRRKQRAPHDTDYSNSTGEPGDPSKYRTWGDAEEFLSPFDLFYDEADNIYSASGKYATEDNLRYNRNYDDILGSFSNMDLDANYDNLDRYAAPPGFQQSYSTLDPQMRNRDGMKFQTIESFHTLGHDLSPAGDIQLPLPFPSRQTRRNNNWQGFGKSKHFSGHDYDFRSGNPTDSAVVFSVQTFKCEDSRSILVYNVPKQLKTIDLLTLFSTYGDIEFMYSGRKDDLSVIVVSYYDLEDAKKSLETLSSSAFPVEVQFCVNVIPPQQHFVGNEIEDVLNQQGLYFDEHKLLVVNSSGISEVKQFCSRYGTIVSFEETTEGIVVEFSSIRSCARCFEGLSNLTPADTIRVLPIPLNRTKLRLGQSLFAFIKGDVKVSGEITHNQVSNLSNTYVPANTPMPSFDPYDPNSDTFMPQPNNQKLNRKPSMGSNTSEGDMSYGRSHRKVVPTGSHPHHQHLQKFNGHHNNAHGGHSNNFEFIVSIESVLSGVDKRTSLMIRNIPNKYTQSMFLEELDEFKGLFDFFYLPIDFKNKCNVGYAFLNVCDSVTIVEVYRRFNNKVWSRFNSDKVCVVSYAKIQGKANLINRFKNSSLMKRDEECRPLIFFSEGPLKGMPEEFPMPNGR